MLLATDSDRVRGLLASLPPSKPRRVVRSIRELSVAFEETHAQAVLLDPDGVPESFLNTPIDQAARRGTRFFIASPLTTRTAELVLHSAHSGLAGALLCDCETDLRAMTRQLSAETAECTLALRLLARIRHRVLSLPRSLRAALVGAATARCYAGTSIGAFASRAGGSPRSLARWLAAAGLAQPRTVLAAFRLAHLWPELASPRLTMSAVADIGGFGGDRTLRAHCERVLRWSPIHIRRFRSDAEVLVGLTRALNRPSAFGAKDAGVDKGDVQVAAEAMASL